MRDRPTTFVNLGALDRILDKRDSVLAKLSKPGALNKAELRELHKLVLEPVEQFVANVHELIIVPGEALAAVPFEALIGADGKHSIESRSLRYLSGAGELVELARSAQALRDNALQSHLAGMTEHDVTGLGEVLIDCKPIWAAQLSSLPSSSLRASKGSGRRSWPLSSSRSKANKNTAPSCQR
jgi:CHAT domain-containing protein